MSHEKKELKQINKYAILIHQLPSEDTQAALSYFSKQSIKKALHISEGLQIFFKEYDLVIKSIRREKIEVGGLFYKIYPLVTNLTICGIGPYATNSTIEDIMQDYGFIIDLYRIQESIVHEGHRTVSLTDDYRVILDVPELFARSLTPVRLPNVTPRTFEVLFFCRLCRCNGHKQFECSNANKNPSFFISSQNGDVARQMSYESDSTNCDKKSRPQFDFGVYEQSSKKGHDSQIKNKEHDHSSHQTCSKDKSLKNSDSKNCCKGAIHSKSIKRRNKIISSLSNRKKQRLDSFSSPSACDSEKFKDNNNLSISKKKSNETSERKNFQKRNFQQYSGSGGSNEKLETSTSNECSSKQISVSDSKSKKKDVLKFLSKLLPPDLDLCGTKKLIQIASKCSPEDIPEDIQDVLQSVLQYNFERKNKYFSKGSRVFLKWISAVLNKIEKTRSVKSHKGLTECTKKKEERVKDKKSNTEIPKKHPVKKAITLSLGMKEAIFRSAGELQPSFLCNFLNQVRGRQNIFEVASAFTNNIPALTSQLLEVQNTYYKYVQKRGPEENRDISYIKRLRNRLLKHGENVTQISAEINMTEERARVRQSQSEPDMTEVPVKTESDMTEVPTKTEPGIIEVPEKTESDMTEVSIKTESDMNEESGKKESDKAEIRAKANLDMTEVPVKTESNITEIEFVKSEPDVTKISVQTEPDITETVVERNYDMAEAITKTEIFMRQSRWDETNNLYPANYFTNITQMPFSLESIETLKNHVK